VGGAARRTRTAGGGGGQGGGWLWSDGVAQGAGDIHLGRGGEQGVVRFRIDGVLHPVYQMPMGVLNAMTARIKLLGRMDVMEKRRPQDGRIKTRNPRGDEIEMRMSTLPTAFGEKMVMRIFDPDNAVKDLDALGFSAHDATRWEALVKRPHGIILATGPTGSGKTLAFVLPLLQRWSAADRDHPRAVHSLILVPTRELAAQVAETLRRCAGHLPERIKAVSAVGGLSINPQMMALRGGADVVIATPGRLLDLVDQRALHLSRVATLVLDEADRLLDLGFSAELTRILALLPRDRQNLLFSATFAPRLRTLAEQVLRDPARIEITADPGETPLIRQRAIEVDTARRTPLLAHLIKSEGWSRVLVFVAKKYSASHVADKLRRAGISAVDFHGELSQGARAQALDDFKQSRVRVLVATDLAARGLDIAGLPVVLNYDQIGRAHV